MMKFFLMPILLSAFTLAVSGQKRFKSQIDSLLNRLNQVEGIAKVDDLNEVSQLYAEDNPKKALSYISQANNLANKLHYGRGGILSMLNKSYSLIRLNELEKAFNYAKKALIWSKKSNYLAGQIIAHKNLSFYYRLNSNYSEAFNHSFLALKLSKPLKDKSVESGVLSEIGEIYYRQANYSKVLEYNLKALAFAESSGNKSKIFSSIRNIGSLYNEMEDLDKALSYYLSSAKVYQQIYGRIHPGFLLNIGQIYFAKGDAGKTLYYIKKAEQDTIQTPFIKYLIASHYGITYLKTKAYGKAFSYLNKSLKMSQELKNDVGLSISYKGLSDIYRHNKKYNTALDYANKALELAKKANLKKQLKASYLSLSETYAAMGNYTQAYVYQSKHIALHDSIFNAENTKKIAFLQQTFELNKKQVQINLLLKTRQLQEVEIKHQNLLQYALLAGLFAVFIFAGLLFVAYRGKHRTNRKLEVRNKEVSRMGEELERTQQKLSSALSLGLVGVWVADLKQELIFADENLARMLGLAYKHQGMPVETFLQCIHPEDSRMEKGIRIQALKERKEYEAEYRVVHTEGSILWVFARGRADYDDSGVPVSFSGVMVDITDKKDAERHKNEFLSIASHELRTPLASTKGYLQLVERTLDNTHLSYPFATKAATQLKRLERLIADLMDVSRIVSGRLVYAYSEFNFLDILKEQVESIQMTISTHKILLEKAVSVTYTGDKYRIEQVLNNLINNAIKYSPQASQVIINAGIEENNILVSIRDFGIGIPEEHIGKLNERFYRVKSDSIKYEGLGLGLYIASEILKQHNGALWAESERGKGSVFYFSLPMNELNPIESDAVNADSL